MNTYFKLIAAAVAGAIAMAVLLPFLNSDNAPETASEEVKPLYWVAPMDSNYRRDEPGLSPMGMELVPVYADDAQAEAGTVTISAAVENNLGVRVAKVQHKALSSDINTVGYVQYNQDQLVHIHPRVEGWIETLFVKAAGEKVQQGEPLYTLYSPQLVNAQEEFLLALKRNNQVLIRAAKARLHSLNVSNEFIAQLQQDLQVKQNITFYTRQSGVVDELQVREGFYVKPGTTMMSIAKLDEVWVEAEVFERQAGLISKGQAVTMRLDYLPGQSWQGQVDYIYPTLEAKNRTLRVRLRFNNNDHLLKPNMFAQVSIHSQSSAAQLVVPKEAVIRTGSQDRVVIALGEGRFKSVAVELGRVGQQEVEILAGLNKDDQVVTSAQFLLDSESSKSADFQRMQVTEEASSVWGQGKITQVMPTMNKVTIDHQAIAELDWPQMVMDFQLSEDVDIEQLASGQTLHFELTKQADNSFLISQVHIMDAKHTMTSMQATVDGVINTIDMQQRVLNISREAIEKWQRGPATMDFMVADNIDLSQWQVKQAINFTFSIIDGEFIIQSIRAQSEQSNMGHHQHGTH